MTATTLYKALRLYIEHQKKPEMQYKAKRAANKTQPAKKHGKVKVKELVGENAGAYDKSGNSRLGFERFTKSDRYYLILVRRNWMKGE